MLSMQRLGALGDDTTFVNPFIANPEGVPVSTALPEGALPIETTDWNAQVQQQQARQNALSASIANALTAGANLYSLPQQQAALQQQAAQAKAAQGQANMLALMQARSGAPAPAQTNWLLYGGIGAAVLVLIVVLASRR